MNAAAGAEQEQEQEGKGIEKRDETERFQVRARGLFFSTSALTLERNRRFGVKG